MKKVLSLSGIALSVLAICSLFVVSCNKENEQTKTPKPESSALKEQEKPIKTFAELDAKVTVIDGVLNFETGKDVQKMLNFFENAPKEEVYEWENSLTGFKSIFSTYEDFIVESRQDTSYDFYKNLLVKYKGFVVEDENGNIKPAIDNGAHFGRFINKDGIYKIGESVTLYSGGKLISVKKESDLEYAKLNLKTDTEKGILVHDVVINSSKKPSDLTQRGLIFFGGKSSNYCESVYNGCNGTSKLINEYEIIQNTSGGIRYVQVKIAIRNRRSRWFGWSETFCGFSWSFNATMSFVNRVFVCTGFLGASTQGIDVFDKVINFGGTVTNSGYLDITLSLYERSYTPTELLSGLTNAQCEPNWRLEGEKIEINMPQNPNLSSSSNGVTNANVCNY